ncbi:hypothetical protein P4S68_20930 [Pseudoalteromonas sp. Hal099]
MKNFRRLSRVKRHQTGLTQSGRELSRLPVDPRLAKMVLTS